MEKSQGLVTSESDSISIKEVSHLPTLLTSSERTKQLNKFIGSSCLSAVNGEEKMRETGPYAYFSRLKEFWRVTGWRQDKFMELHWAEKCLSHQPYSCGLEGTNYSRKQKYVNDHLLLKVMCLFTLPYRTILKWDVLNYQTLLQSYHINKHTLLLPVYV